MNNKCSQAIFVLNLDKKIDLAYFFTQNIFQNCSFIGFFQSYPQFVIFVYAIVDKPYLLSE